MADNKICAFIRQTWYESAKKNLPPEDRLRFYEVCMEYEFYDTLPADDIPVSVRLLFDMVSNTIDEDKQRARARAERNRANGAKGGRPATHNQTQQNPNNPNGFFGLAITNTNTNTITKDNILCLNRTENEDTHTFFRICLDFFSRGCRDAIAEGNLFWNYYAAKGWRTKDGSDIVDRIALARAWRCSDCSAFAMKRRSEYVAILQRTAATETSLLRDFVNIVQDTKCKKVILSLSTKESAQLIEDKYLEAVRDWIPTAKDGTPYQWEYCIISPELLN